MQARHGALHEVVSAPIIPALLEGGLVFVLRWALDDSMDNSMVAAVHALHALLVCDEDEVSGTERGTKKGARWANVYSEGSIHTAFIWFVLYGNALLPR